ncbi:polysaccharide biosynthesis/export family protein [Rhizobium sp. G21]|uniref:polysaccharide biosynthesis/export family protein n=1 Tax=Rhizobium sp. G21 TaxID=2758439 RepID=UPI0016038B21|nr:polysaccharide biosynthesis/export family protein [Rhizobium sp. G21]MBB1250084.1 polysaccharide export protein [Rhizobium sp. G21]
MSILTLVAASISITSGCSAVPSNGPLAIEVNNSGAPGASYSIPKTSIVFDIVSVDQRVANSVTTLGTPSLVRTFGVGGTNGQPVIGVGDELQVTIFEAGADGLFSTSERKQTTIPVIVQPDGNGQIPYAGAVRFAGKTLDGAREEIAAALKAKAVEPDVIVGMSKNTSRTASVQGAVNQPNIIQIGLSPLPLTSAIAMAGGASKPSYDTYVTVTRGRKSGTVLLQSIIDNPRDDINVSPRDKIFLTYDPQSFTVLGSTEKTGKISFQASSISLVEATAMAGGAKLTIADPAGYFIFRYENEAVYREVVGESRFRQLLSKGMMANKDGRYPIVYRIDMNDPQSYIVTQSFPVRNKDVLYLSRHPATDFAVFMRLIGGPVSVARNVQRL